MLPKPPRRCFPAWNLKSGFDRPVRMHMREMGTVELLTREAKLTSLKRIEDRITGFNSVAEYPEAITICGTYDVLKQKRVCRSIAGFVDPNAEEDLAPPLSVLSFGKIWTMTR